MKVKIISRNPDNYLRETKKDIHKLPRNYDPKLHPLEVPREYVRALNATKLERVFAKPFICALDGHKDGISCMTKNPKSLSSIISGSYDGEIKIWGLQARECIKTIQAHDGYTRGITFMPDGDHFISIGDDKTIKTWKSSLSDYDNDEPVNTILSNTVLTGISHHRNQPIFATSGEVCYLWEETRNEPLKILKWGVDTLNDVKFNNVETSLLAACASDRSIILYDQREKKPLRKVVMTMRPNRLCWNPMEAFIFSVANEDFSSYTFDTRKLRSPLKIHEGHVGAVLDIDYSPTGKEIVTGSYDKTLRIYDINKQNSREVYHTKRMQHVTSVTWSLDDKYVFSGSDEMNIRIWKARPAEKLGAIKPRERASLNYNEALKEKYAAHPQIKRIARHRHVPKHIFNEQNKIRSIKNKEKRKDTNRRIHSKPGTVPIVPEKEKRVIKEVE